MGAITEAGFVRPTFAQLLAVQEAKARELFGNDVDTGENTALGKFIRITVYDLARLYEDMEGVYFARFPNYAQGINLDRLMPFAGITRNPAVAAAYRVRFSGTEGAGIDAGFLVATTDGVTFRTETPVTVGAGGTVETVVVCLERGETGNVAAGAITIIVNPDARVSRVEQLAPQLAEGRPRESDAELRGRFAVAIAGIGSATLDAVKAAVTRVSGVLGCVILENDTAETSPDGLPPHSFEAFVLAGSIPDYDIAEAIFQKKPVGIHSHGSVEVTVQDSAGNGHVVRFSRVGEIEIHIRLTVKTSNLFPADGAAAIRQELAGTVNAFPNGRDLVFSSLYPVVYRIPGVMEVAGLGISTDGGATYTTANVVATAAEAIRLDRAAVEVEVVPYVDH